MKIATFVSDVTPPVGSPLCHGTVPPAVGVTHPLSCRGVVLWGAEDPIVLCALDWIGISGSGHHAWRARLAEAAGTTPERVAVHTLHQHDAPGADPDAEALMAARGLPGAGHDTEFADATLRRAQAAVRAAIPHSVPVTHIGTGSAEVVRVASNRRVHGPDGTVDRVRFSSCADPVARAAPEGIVDRMARALSLWNDDTLVASLSYYATHPQSHYRERLVSYDFVGMAREALLQMNPRVVHTHFCGAAGNVAAGRYNDGSPANRAALAARLADGLGAALAAAAQNRTRVGDTDLEWTYRAVSLPIAQHLVDGETDAAFEREPTFAIARRLAWRKRQQAGQTIDLSCLRIGPAAIVHFPGEPFVEYQLAAQALRPDLFVTMAGYGDLGPGYIGTELAYAQGGYEVGIPSRVAPDVEKVLFSATAEMLGTTVEGHESPSDITARAPRSRSMDR